MKRVICGLLTAFMLLAFSVQAAAKDKNEFVIQDLVVDDVCKLSNIRMLEYEHLSDDTKNVIVPIAFDFQNLKNAEVMIHEVIPKISFWVMDRYEFAEMYSFKTLAYNDGRILTSNNVLGEYDYVLDPLCKVGYVVRFKVPVLVEKPEIAISLDMVIENEHCEICLRK